MDPKNITSIDINLTDGTKVSLNVAPVVEPEALEVDVVLSDGTTKKFVPAS